MFRSWVACYSAQPEILELDPQSAMCPLLQQKYCLIFSNVVREICSSMAIRVAIMLPSLSQTSKHVSHFPLPAQSILLPIAVSFIPIDWMVYRVFTYRTSLGLVGYILLQKTGSHSKRRRLHSKLVLYVNTWHAMRDFELALKYTPWLIKIQI